MIRKNKYREVGEVTPDLGFNEVISLKLNNTMQIVYSNENKEKEKINSYIMAIEDFSKSLNEFGLSLKCKKANKDQLKSRRSKEGWIFYIKYKVKKSLWILNYFGIKTKDVISIYVPTKGTDYFFILFDNDNMDFSLQAQRNANIISLDNLKKYIIQLAGSVIITDIIKSQVEYNNRKK